MRPLPFQSFLLVHAILLAESLPSCGSPQGFFGVRSLWWAPWAAGHMPLLHGSTTVISVYKQLQSRKMKKEHDEEVVSSSNLPCFSPLKTFFLFQFWVVFRVLINLENKNNFQIISAMVDWNTSQAGLIVPGSYKIPVGAGCKVPGWFERTACPRYKCQNNWKYLLKSWCINQQTLSVQQS